MLNLAELREIGLKLSAISKQRKGRGTRYQTREEAAQARREYLKQWRPERRKAHAAARWQRIKADPARHARLLEARRRRFERRVIASGRPYVPQLNRRTGAKRPMRRNNRVLARIKPVAAMQQAEAA